MRAPWTALPLLLAACAGDPPAAPRDATTADVADAADGADATTADAPAADAPAGPLTVALRAPGVGYLGASTCATAAHDGGPGARVTWRWEPENVPEAGDGRSCHTFTRPGEFRVFVTVEARGMRAEASATLRVVPRPSDPRPTASSTIAYDAARDEVWVANPDADTVTVLSAEPLRVLAEVPVGDHPRTVAITGGTVAVACQGDGTLHLLDAARRARVHVATLGAGARPYGVAADPRGERFFVTLQDAGELVLVDARTGAKVSHADVGFDARAVAVNANGLALVTRWRASPEGARVVAVDARDPARPRVAGATTLPRQEGLDSDTDNSGVPNFLDAVVYSPEGEGAVVPALKANIVTGMHRTREALTSQTTARAVVAQLYPRREGGGLEETARFSLDDLDYASAAVFSPEGARLYVAVMGAEVVVALDALSFNVAGSISLVGGAPRGLALSPDGRLLFVHGYTTRSVRVYDVRDLAREPVALGEVTTVAREPLSPEALRGLQVFYRSRDPRMSRTSYLSCATCHLDGEGDNLVWDFTQRGEGLRNTIALAGRGGVAHGPIHWSANFDEVQDFEHDIRGPQGGAGFMPDAAFHTGTRDQTLGDRKAGVSPELDALAAYAATLSRFGVSPFRRDADAGWRAAVARGEAVFRAAGCAACHAGPRFTDSAFRPDGTPLLHDVGTLGAGSGRRLGMALPGVDTPTLRGLWQGAPYLHDGSAATLRDVLTTRNPMDRHGRTRGLPERDLDDLETYLLSLDDTVR